MIEEKETYKNIDTACENFKSISDNIVNSKFEHIDKWLNKKSKTFVKENTTSNTATYPRFDYGTILKVDFGINDGSEISGPHFAIALERYDSTKNPVITVLPLTSQYKKYYLPLNELITDEFTKRLNAYLNIYLNKQENREKLKKEGYLPFDSSVHEDMCNIKKMITYYSSYAKSSYACINQITTISKKKIMSPKNRFDIIGRAKCGSKIMQVISQEILAKYTNIKI